MSRGLKIPRIAVVPSAKGENRCDHDNRTYGDNGGVNTMQAFHGFDKNVADARWDMDIGLNEIFFIVLSKLWRPEQGKVDSRYTLQIPCPNLYLALRDSGCSPLINC